MKGDKIRESISLNNIYEDLDKKIKGGVLYEKLSNINQKLIILNEITANLKRFLRK